MAFNNEDGKGVRAEMIIEVLGRPPQHLIDTLNKIIEEIDKENGVKVLRKKVNEPQELKDKQQGFYTTFAEIEVEAKEILYIAMLMFKYMPAHIEITYPEAIALTNNGWNEILNELTRRLHGYDEVARVLQIEKNILEKKLRDLLIKEPDEAEEKITATLKKNSTNKKNNKK
ncbi:MAG: hypothetical protein PHV68_09890 [Candidatus Gastranaerophilales bacterium]|nr:hypothetical protein [Candidatus Gastranaerophilales bacterium]